MQTAPFVDRLVTRVQADKHVPALTAAVFRDGAVQHVATAGTTPAPGAGLQYRIGGITKTFTAALVLRLRDEGHLALDDLLYRHIPGTPLGGITLRQLLSHTSGLQREPEGAWWQRCAGVGLEAFLDRLGPDQAARPRYHYSNLAYGLLGAVVTRITGMDWTDALKKHLFEPLALRRTGYFPEGPYTPGYVAHPWHGTLREEPVHDTRAMAPAGQLWSTASDLSRWGAFLADPDPAVLDRTTLDEMCTPVAVHDLDAWTGGHGLGLQLWRRGERVIVGHTGAAPGYACALVVHRPTRTGAVVLANTFRKDVAEELALELLNGICDREPLPAVPWRPAVAPPQDLAPLTGRWWWMGREHESRWNGTELLIGPAGAQPWRFVPDGVDRWRGRGGEYDGEALKVLRDPGGQVIALDVATLLFTRDPGA
jgi:CubicO group peptidase (beta-lactamase class C family)